MTTVMRMQIYKAFLLLQTLFEANSKRILKERVKSSKSNKKNKIDLSGSKPKPTENILKKSNSREKINTHKINDVLKGASINNQVVIFDDIKTDKK